MKKLLCLVLLASLAAFGAPPVAGQKRFPAVKLNEPILSVREVPSDGWFPDATFVQVNQRGLQPGVIYVLEVQSPGGDWELATRNGAPVFFQSGSGYQTYGFIGIGNQWRIVRGSQP